MNNCCQVAQYGGENSQWKSGALPGVAAPQARLSNTNAFVVNNADDMDKLMTIGQ